MVILRKDRSLDASLIAVFDPVSPAQANKIREVIIQTGGQFITRNDGSIKYYLPEEKVENEKEVDERIFSLPEKLRDFSKPSIYIEAAEYAEFFKGEKIYVHIISNINGHPLRAFLVSGPKVENEGHAFFRFIKGFEIIAFLKDKQLFVEIVELFWLSRENNKYCLREKVLGEWPAVNPTLPSNLRNLDRAIKATRDKFFCPHCTHAHYYSKN